MMRWRAWIGCLAILALIAGCHKATSSTTTTVAINISAATVAIGGTVSFTAQVTTAASDMTVIWQVDSVTGGDSIHGTIDTNGNYTAPNLVPSPNTVTVTAIANADKTATASAIVTIDSGIRVTVAPLSPTIGTNETLPFTASVTGTSIQTVTWMVCQVSTAATSATTPCPADTTGTLGKIDAAGNYSAPAVVPATNPVTIEAVSTKDTNQFGSATISLVAAVDPTATSVYPTTVGQGSKFVDIFLTGTNFLTTTQVFVNGVQLGGIQNPIASFGDVLRARITDNFMSASPTVLNIQVERQGGNLVSCAPDPTKCRIAVQAFRPAIVSSTPESIVEGDSSPPFTIDGGYFGTTSNGSTPSVTVDFDGSIRPGGTFSDRQIAVSLNNADATVPGLHQVTVTNSAVTQPVQSPQQTAAINLAVQPNVAPSFGATVPVGTNPVAIAINTATGIAVVANHDSSDLTLVDLTGASPAVVPGGTISLGAGAGPTGVAVDNVRNLAVVVNNTAKTVAVVNLATRAVQTVNTFITAAPFSVGVNPITGLALVAYQSTNIGAIVDLTQTPPAFVGTVTLGTGTNPHVAVMPALNWAMVTPGGAGTFSIVDLARQLSSAIAPMGAARVSSTSIVTITTTGPHGLINGQAVLITGVADNSFNGIFTVASVPTSTTFTYTQTGTDATSGGGTVFSSDPLATVSFGTAVSGIAVNPESKQAILTDPTSQFPLEIMSLLDQTVTPVVTAIPPAVFEAGMSAVAVNPYTDVAVALNPQSAHPITILDPRVDPNHTPVIKLQPPLPGGSGPNLSAVAIDPGTNTALIVDQSNNQLIVLSLGAIKTPQLESVIIPINRQLGTDLTLASSAQDLSLTLIGKGFKPSMVARVDGQPVLTVGTPTDRVMSVLVKNTNGLLASARRFAVDVVDPAFPGVVSNVEGFSVVQPVDLTSPACASPMPSAVAIDDVLNLALVTESSCNTLALVDLATGTVTKTITVGSNPQGVASSPSNGLAVVSNRGDNTAIVLNIGDTTQPSITIPVGIEPIGVAISPLDGLTLVTNFNGNSNSVSSFNIPATTGAMSTSVGVGSGPVAVAIDPVGLTAAVADASSNQITLLDISSGSPTIKGNNNGPNQPAGVVFDPVNKVYILTSSLGNALIFLDPVSQQLRAARIGINPTSIAYNFQTSTIVTVNSLSSTVSMMDINDQRVKANFGLKGSLLGAVAIHPRTNLVYIADQQNSRLLIVPLPF